VSACCRDAGSAPRRVLDEPTEQRIVPECDCCVTLATPPSNASRPTPKDLFETLASAPFASAVPEPDGGGSHPASGGERAASPVSLGHVVLRI
jgi:hypothetical protein